MIKSGLNHKEVDVTARIRVVFMGSAELACPGLEKLRQSPAVHLTGVVTQPKRPKGRRLRQAACPVCHEAAELGVPMLTPQKINTPQNLDCLRELRPDVIVVVAYGQFLRKEILRLPPLGCINLHASLLPKYRGAAPIQWAVAKGETETGVTTMFMNEQMDAGDIIFQEAEPIEPEDTTASLQTRLAKRGADLMHKTLLALRDGTAPRRPQDQSLVTFAPLLQKTDGKLDWSLPARELHNRVRAFTPWPGCHFSLPAPRCQTIKVLQTRVESYAAASARPGTVLEIGGEGPLIMTKEETLRLLQVQPEGRKSMSGSAFLCGYGMCQGMTLQ